MGGGLEGLDILEDLGILGILGILGGEMSLAAHLGRTSLYSVSCSLRSRKIIHAHGSALTQNKKLIPTRLFIYSYCIYSFHLSISFIHLQIC